VRISGDGVSEFETCYTGVERRILFGLRKSTSKQPECCIDVKPSAWK